MMTSLLDLLRDPVWQGIAAWVAIILFFYFLHDRYITKDRVTKIKAFFVRVLWTTVISYAFSGLISLSVGLHDGFSESVLGAWLTLGAFITIIALIVNYQDEKKRDRDKES